VVVQLLAERTLTADRIQADQQRGLQQPFGRNGRTSSRAIHGVECRRQLHQRSIGEALHRAQRVMRWYSFFEIYESQHARLRIPPTTHCRSTSPDDASTVTVAPI